MRRVALTLSLAACGPAPEMADPQVRTLTLDAREPEIPAGAGRELFVERCLACHSARYVLHQPGLSRDAWTAVVAKMGTAYKAPLDDAAKAVIVDYLVAVAGPP